MSRKAGLVTCNSSLGRQTPSLQTFPHSSFYLSFIAEYDTRWYGLSLWSVCVSCPGLCPLPASLLAGQHEKQKRPCLRLSPVLQQLKHLCVITTISIKNPKCGIVWASTNKINPISAKTMTPDQPTWMISTRQSSGWKYHDHLLSDRNGLFVTRQLPWRLRTSMKAVFPWPYISFFFLFFSFFFPL